MSKQEESAFPGLSEAVCWISFFGSVRSAVCACHHCFHLRSWCAELDAWCAAVQLTLAQPAQLHAMKSLFHRHNIYKRRPAVACVLPLVQGSRSGFTHLSTGCNVQLTHWPCPAGVNFMPWMNLQITFLHVCSALCYESELAGRLIQRPHSFAKASVTKWWHHDGIPTVILHQDKDTWDGLKWASCKPIWPHTHTGITPPMLSSSHDVPVHTGHAS